MKAAQYKFNSIEWILLNERWVNEWILTKVLLCDRNYLGDNFRCVLCVSQYSAIGIWILKLLPTENLA